MHLGLFERDQISRFLQCDQQMSFVKGLQPEDLPEGYRIHMGTIGAVGLAVIGVVLAVYLIFGLRL